MLRGLLLAVMVANLLFFGWTHGWLGEILPPPALSEREPERMATQVRPERIVVLKPESPNTGPATTAGAGAAAMPPASAAAAEAAAPTTASAAPEALQCLEAGPFSDAQVVVASQALGKAGVDTTAVLVQRLDRPSWMVFAGRFADNAARRTRLQAWQRQNVPAPELLETPPALAPGLVFSRHLSTQEAEAALATLVKKHPAVASVARIIATPAGAPATSTLRAATANSLQAQRLRAVSLPAAARFTPCAKP